MADTDATERTVAELLTLLANIPTAAPRTTNRRLLRDMLVSLLPVNGKATGSLSLGVPTVIGNRLAIKGDASNTEIVTVDAPAGQTTDLETWRVNGVVVADITSTGALECAAIAFETLNGGESTLADISGGSLSFNAGALTNGNIVINAKVAGSTHFQYASVSKHIFGPASSTHTGTLTSTGGFAANGNAAQGKATVNAACTDLATAVALVNQLRAALIANGICV